MAQYIDKKLAFEIVKGVLNLLQSEDNVKSLLPKISNNAPIIYEGFMSNLSDLYKFANNEYKDKIVNVVLDNIALDNLIEVKEVDLQEEPKTDWLQELQDKIDSLSKEDFEKVMTKYSRYGEEKSVDYDKLNTMLDESLSKETKESWNKRLGKEPASEDLKTELNKYIKGHFTIDTEQLDRFGIEEKDYMYSMGKSDMLALVEHFTKWQKNHLWKSADGDDLPEIDREVIALLDNGKVVFAHRPPEYWDGKDIVTGKVTRHYPKTYDKGGWNMPNVKYWLDCLMPKEIEL